MRYRCLLWSLLLVGVSTQADVPFAQRHQLPAVGVVVVSEGQDEVATAGSYSVRLFAGESTGGLSGFQDGLLRPRPGRVETLHWVDMDGNGSTDLVVSLRAEDGSVLADVFRFDGGRVTWVKHSGRLAADADPVRAMAGKVMAPEKPAAVGAGSGPLQLHKRRSRGTTVLPESSEGN